MIIVIIIIIIVIIWKLRRIEWSWNVDVGLEYFDLIKSTLIEKEQKMFSSSPILISNIVQILFNYCCDVKKEIKIKKLNYK